MRIRNLTITALLCLALVPAAFAQDTTKPAPHAPTAKMGSMTQKPVIKKVKKTPPRDPKTGRFIKASDKMTVKGTKGNVTIIAGDKMKKTMPPRDPKTGRFIKAAPKP
jgi:hypothetical protein